MRSIYGTPLRFGKVNFDNATEQKIYLTFDENKLSNFAFAVAASEEVRATRRSSIVQVEPHGLSGNGGQYPYEQFRPEKALGNASSLLDVALILCPRVV